MDLPRYGVWNPYTVAARGTVQEGQGVTFTIQLPRATRFVHYIKTLRLIPEPDGKTRVVHRGFYTGILVPLFWRWFTADRIVQGTIMEDAALKRAAEGEGAVEREAPVIEHFGNRDRAARASIQRWFNRVRRNSHKWDKRPLDILREAAPKAVEAVVTLPVLDLDDLVRRKIRHQIQSPSPIVGYHVPGRAPIGGFLS